MWLAKISVVDPMYLSATPQIRTVSCTGPTDANTHDVTIEITASPANKSSATTSKQPVFSYMQLVWESNSHRPATPAQGKLLIQTSSNLSRQLFTTGAVQMNSIAKVLAAKFRVGN